MANAAVPFSCVLLVPVALAPAADALSVALGYAAPGDATYSRDLIKNGAIAYKGAHTWASDVFITLINDARNGVIPDDLSNKGYSGAQVQYLVNAMIISVRNFGEPLDHWNLVLTANGITEPPPSEDI